MTDYTSQVSSSAQSGPFGVWVLLGKAWDSGALVLGAQVEDPEVGPNLGLTGQLPASETGGARTRLPIPGGREARGDLSPGLGRVT